jgi:membrane protein YdbS with pleckstrin-like domain
MHRLWAVPFPRKLLNDHEELVLDLRPHWIYLARSGITLAVALIVGIFVLASGPDGSVGQGLRIVVGLAVLAALGWFAKTYAQWSTTMFVLTTDRIVSRRGLLSKEGVEIPLERINTVFFHQTIFERMVGAGDVTIESAGEKGSESFSDIRRPSVVQKEIYVQMEENENRMRRPYQPPPAAPGHDPTVAQGSGSPAPQPAHPGHVDVTVQIEKLADLHARGVLTDEEFATKKAELLGRL